MSSCRQFSLCRLLPRLASISIILLLSATFGIAQQSQPTSDPDGELRKFDQVSKQSAERERGGENDEDVRGREEWFYFQRRFPYDMIPAGMRTRAVREVELMQQRLGGAKRGASVMASAQWEQIGPYNIAGRIRALAVHPTDPQTVYVGAAAGGVWKTTDGGQTWASTFDKQSALAIGSLAISPTNSHVVYAGTGENSYNTDSYLGDGIFRSTDDGATWTNIGLNSVGAISKIYLHRQQSNIIYAVATKNNGGFYRSTNAGATWTQVFSGNVYDLAVNPANSDEVYASTETSIRRSTDGGATFKDVTSGITVSSGLRISIAVAPSSPSRIFALVARSGGINGSHIGDVYRSTDKGASWTLMTTMSQFFFNQQGWYDNCVAVHPTDPNTVLVGGVDVYRSTDGGGTWTNSTRSYSGGVAHPDQHVLAFDQANPSVVYLGNDGGTFVSVDAGANWIRYSVSLPVTQYYAMDVDQTRNYRAFGGSQDNGTHGSLGTTKYPTSWNSILGGDGFFVAVDLTDSNIVYAENYNGTPIQRINAKNSSSIGQRTVIDATLGSGTPDAGTWSSPLLMSPADRKTLYSGRTFLWRTATARTSNSPTWTKLTPGNLYKISAVGLSPFDAGKMIVGTTGGELRYSVDDGATWKSSTGVPRRFVTDLLYDPVNSGRVYATLSGSGTHVFVSNDDGATFTDISSNLPNIPVNAIEIDPKDATRLFIGTDAGVFISQNGGALWVPYNDGLPLVPVADLRIHRLSRTLLAATHGRSMFSINIDNGVPQPAILQPLGGESYSTPGDLTVRWFGLSGPVQVLLSYDGGQTFPLVVNNVLADSAVFTLPFVKTDMARVKVVQTTSGSSLMSGNFSLNPTPNTQSFGTRSARSEALAVRNGYLWATQHDNDTIYKYRTPALATNVRQFVVRSGIPGTIRDLAYDPAGDRFYALVADADFGNAKVFAMDTNGTAAGQVTLPTASVSGIAMVPQGLALVTPGAGGMLYVIDPDNHSIVSQSSGLQGATGSQRRGLDWDGQGFVQGVSDAPSFNSVYTELQRFTGFDNPQVVEKMPVVLSSGPNPVFFSIAYDGSSSNPAQRYYYATDTAGIFYRIPAFVVVLGVKEPAVLAGAHQASISAVTPNPLRGAGSVRFELRSRQQVRLDLYTTDGEKVMNLLEGSLEAGSHNADLVSAGLASGIYYVTLQTASGERDVATLVLLK